MLKHLPEDRVFKTPDKSHRCRFLEFFLPFFCTIYTGTKCEKQAKIHFLWSLNCSFEFSVFLIVENCFQGNIFTTNTDAKNTENSNISTIKSEF